jgi:hypothetical protein
VGHRSTRGQSWGPKEVRWHAPLCRARHLGPFGPRSSSWPLLLIEPPSCQKIYAIIYPRFIEATMKVKVLSYS